MRIYSFLVILIGIASCSPADRKNLSIEFVTRSVQSPSLRVNPVLTGYPDEQRMELNLELKNLQPERIKITDVTLQNSKGLKSSAEGIADQVLTVAGTQDTTLLLKFAPINDRSLFMATGLRGLLDSAYHVSVYYSIEGKEGTRVVNLISKMKEETFVSYKKAYDVPIQLYYLNTANGFAEKQRQFLMTNATAKTPPFVHLTEQEMAVSGLNFRIKCFHRKDSLYTEVFIVNHSDMTVRMDTSKFDLAVDHPNNQASANISIEKVTGSKDDVHILRKGDRVVITMGQNVVNPPERVWLNVQEVFFLSDSKPLLTANLELLRSIVGVRRN